MPDPAKPDQAPPCLPHHAQPGLAKPRLALPAKPHRDAPRPTPTRHACRDYSAISSIAAFAFPIAAPAFLTSARVLRGLCAANCSSLSTDLLMLSALLLSSPNTLAHSSGLRTATNALW